MALFSLLSVFYDRIPIIVLSNATTPGTFVMHILLKCASTFPMTIILHSHISYGIPFCFYVSFWLENYQLKSNYQKSFFFILLVKITHKRFWLLFHLARYSTRISFLCTLRKLFRLLDDILQKDVQLSILDDTFLFI